MEAKDIVASSKVEVKKLLRVARNAALSAGAFQLQQFACQSNAITQTKEHDLTLKVDQVSETIIMDNIAREFPDHAILSEEKGLVNGQSDYIWIIDPLDGTVNYYFGLPLFCVCVACYRWAEYQQRSQTDSIHQLLGQAQPVVGVVYAPMLNRLYCAANEGRATWNDRRILPPPDICLEDAIVGMSFGSDEETILRMEALSRVLVRRAKKVRILGATGLDLVHVAMGNMGALIQQKVQTWDIAAALIILAQSNCKVDLKPNTDGSWQILAAPAILFETLKEVLASHLCAPSSTIECNKSLFDKCMS